MLVNNAGLMPIRPMAEVNTDEWDAMIDVNLKGRSTASPRRCHVSLRRKAGTSSIFSLGDKVRVTSIAPGAVEIFSSNATKHNQTLPKLRATHTLPSSIQSPPEAFARTSA